jgi:hypothetical protein
MLETHLRKSTTPILKRAMNRRILKQLCVGIATVALLAGFSSSAWALGVSLDVPVTYEFDEGGSADSVGGFKVGLSLPLIPLFGIGIGYESYTVEDEDDGVTSEVAFEIYDLFLEIPFPFINLTVGAGFGTQNIKIDDLGVDEDGDVSQVFVSLGYPIFPLFDLHVGYHMVNAEKVDVDLGAFGQAEADASGEMWSLGVRVGF